MFASTFSPAFRSSVLQHHLIHHMARLLDHDNFVIIKYYPKEKNFPSYIQFEL